MLGGDPQADQRTPVLDDDGDIAQIKLFEPVGGPVDVTLIGVVLDAGGLVGAAESDQVWGEHTVAGIDQRPDHVAVQVTPRRFAV